MKKEKKENILNQHSALTTFKVQNGKYYKIGVEKSIFALLLKSQYELKEEFKKLFTNILKKIGISKSNHDDILKIAFTNKANFDISTNSIKTEPLKTISKTIIDFKIEQLKKRTSDERILKMKMRDIKDLSLNDINKEQIDNLQLNEIIVEIKDYCKDIAVKNQLDQKEIDFTSLANSIGTNITKLKKNITQASKTVLEFNYINKKNIEIDIVTSLLASARFEVDKSKKTTWFTYQIPKEILELLLMPKVYVPLEGVVVDKLNGVYTLRMYSLLKDHLKRGTIELTKEEMFEFFALPKSYLNKTNLINKFLIPTLEEVEKVSGISTEYEFVPKNRYKKLVFKHKLKRKVKTEGPVIIEKGKSKHQQVKIIEESNILLKKIEKAKKNIFVSKSWNKRADNKINRIIKEQGEEYAIFILDALYKNLKKEIETTLVQYINGIIKNNPKNEIIEPVEAEKIKKIVKLKQNKKKSNIDSNIDIVEEVIKIKKEDKSKRVGVEINIGKSNILKKPEIKLDKAKSFMIGLFKKMNDKDKKNYEDKALKLFLYDYKQEKLDTLHKKIYKSIKEEYIIRIIEMEF